jgi:hypothetical protein
MSKSFVVNRSGNRLGNTTINRINNIITEREKITLNNVSKYVGVSSSDVVPIRFSLSIRDNVPYGNVVDLINAGNPGIVFIDVNNSEQLYDLKSEQIFVNASDNYKICYYASIRNDETSSYDYAILTLPDGYYYITGFQYNYTYDNGISLVKYRPENGSRNSRKIYRIENGIPTSYAPIGLYLGKSKDIEKIIRVLDAEGNCYGARSGIYSILLDETGEYRKFGFVINHENFSEKDGNLHYMPICGVRIFSVGGENKELHRTQLMSPSPYWEIHDITGNATRVPSDSYIHAANLDYVQKNSDKPNSFLEFTKKFNTKKSIIKCKTGILIKKQNEVWSFLHKDIQNTALINAIVLNTKWSDTFSGTIFSSLDNINPSRNLKYRSWIAEDQSYYLSAEISSIGLNPIAVAEPFENDSIIDIIPLVVIPTINYQETSNSTPVLADDLPGAKVAEAPLFASNYTGNYKSISRNISGLIKPLIQNQDDVNTAMYKAQLIMGVGSQYTDMEDADKTFILSRSEYIRHRRIGKYPVINTINCPAFPIIDSSGNQEYQIISNSSPGVYTIPIGEPFLPSGNMITFENDSPVTINGYTSDGFLKIRLSDDGTSGEDTIQGSIVLLDAESSLSTVAIQGTSSNVTGSWNSPRYIYIPLGDAFTASYTMNPSVQLFTNGGSCSVKKDSTSNHWNEFDFVLCSYGNQIPNTLDSSTAKYTSPKTGYVMSVGANVVATSTPKRTINGADSQPVAGFTGQIVNLKKGYSYRLYMRIMCQSSGTVTMSCTDAKTILFTDEGVETIAGPFYSPDLNKRASYNYPKYIYYPIGSPFTAKLTSDYDLTTTGGTCHVHEGSGSDYSEYSFILASFGNQTPGVADKPPTGTIYYGASGKIIDPNTYVNVIAESSPRRTISGRDQQPVTGFNNTRVTLELGKTYQMYMRCMCQTDDYVSFGWQTGKAVTSSYQKVVSSTPSSQRAERNEASYRFCHAYPDQTITFVDKRRYQLGLRLYCNSDDPILFAYSPITIKEYSVPVDSYDINRFYGFSTIPKTLPLGRQTIYKSKSFTALPNTSAFVITFNGAYDIIGGSGLDYIIPTFELYNETTQRIQFTGFTLQSEAGQMTFFDYNKYDEIIAEGDWGDAKDVYDIAQVNNYLTETVPIAQRNAGFRPVILTANIGFVPGINPGDVFHIKFDLNVQTDDNIQMRFDSFTIVQLSSSVLVDFPGIQTKYNFTDNLRWTKDPKSPPHVIPPNAVIFETEYVPISQEIPFNFYIPATFYDQCPTIVSIAVKGKQEYFSAIVSDVKVIDDGINVKEPANTNAITSAFVNLASAYYQYRNPFVKVPGSYEYGNFFNGATQALNSYWTIFTDNKPAYTVSNGIPSFSATYKANDTFVTPTPSPGTTEPIDENVDDIYDTITDAATY